MSRVLQVIIGIGVVLVVVALVFAALGPLLLPQLRPATAAGQPGYYNRPQAGPMFRFREWRPFGARMPFFGLFGLARLGWPVLVGGLIALVVFALLRRPAPPLPAPVYPTLAVQMACSQCGQPLAAGWKHCPNCGKVTTA
jgi:hypothetical protein